MSIQPKTLTFVYTGSTHHGGAAGVLAWSIHALHQNYTIKVFSLHRCDFAHWNVIFGTRIAGENIHWSSLEQINPCLYSTLKRLNLSTLNQYILMKWVSSKLTDSEIPFSVHNEMSFPIHGIQYIHFPMLMTGRRDLSVKVGQYGSRTKDVFGKICKMFFKVDNDDLSRNSTICNSAYIKEIFKKYYGDQTKAQVLYPPCFIPNHLATPFSNRDDAIVLMGRADPRKRFEDAISVQHGCLQNGVRLKLHIVTSGGDIHYLNLLKNKTAIHQDVFWHINIGRDELASLLSTCKYGLHCMHGEHFGMATAEMAGAGCVVFGHDSGGTREILPYDQLRFTSVDDAVKKIVTVHNHSGLRQELSEKLLSRSKMFSHTEFCAKIMVIVNAFATRV